MNSEHIDTGPYIDNPTRLHLLSEEKGIIKSLFQSCQRVTLKEEFGGGLSGSRVLLVRPVAHEHGPELPAVVKIAPKGLIEQEWRAYQDCVHNRLPGVAEIIGEPVFLSGWGGLRYKLMGGSGTFEVESLYQYYQHANSANICFILEERLFRIIGTKWWRFSDAVADWPLQAIFDPALPVNLLIELSSPPQGTSVHPLTPDNFRDQSLEPGDFVRLGGFIITEVEPAEKPKTVTLNIPRREDDLPASYRLRVQLDDSVEALKVGDTLQPVEGRVIETRSTQLSDVAQRSLGSNFELGNDTLVSPAGTALPNPLTILPLLLRKTRDVRKSYIHGDLNLENILVEPANRNLSLIDFATARKDYVLHDLLHLETEIVTKFLSSAVTNPNQLVEIIYGFYRQLHETTFVTNIAVDSHSLPSSLEKPFEMLKVIRRMAQQCFFDQNDWGEYYEGLAVYCLGALKFKNLDQLPEAPLPKQITFWTAAVACDFVDVISSRGDLTTIGWHKIEWEPLRKYLPTQMYQEQSRATCLAHLNQLLRAVVSYVPRHLALELLQKPEMPRSKGHFVEGTLLFADISGFTELSEKLNDVGGKVGAEEIVRIVNEYLDVMLDILYQYGGVLVKFGGDAMLCFFTGPDQGAMNALRAAWAMRQAMAEHFSEVKIFQEVLPLSMKVGENSGLLFAANVGSEQHMEYVLTGSAVEKTARAESAAHRGELLISRDTLNLIKNAVEAEVLAEEEDFYRVNAIHDLSFSQLEDSWQNIEQSLSDLENDLSGIVASLDVLTPYLPSGVLTQLVSNIDQTQIESQHRHVTVLFANFTGMSDIIDARGIENEAGIAADFDEYFQAIQEEVEYYGGVINKVDLYDQGDKLMVIFGAPMAHEKDAQRAALTALAMQKVVGNLKSPIAPLFLSQRIGIHTGFVFAGNVGSARCNRYEYTVMGDTVNMAARLMSVAPNDGILISERVWSQIQTGFQAKKVYLPLELPGVSKPVRSYELQARLRAPAARRGWLRELRSDLVGRDAELNELVSLFNEAVSAGGKQIIGIAGETGVGKTRLIEEWHQQAVILAEQEKMTVTWLSGAGHVYGQQTSGVLIEIVEQLLGFDEGESQEERWNKLSSRVKQLSDDEGSGWNVEDFLNTLVYLGNFLTLDLSKRRGLPERLAQLDAKTLQIQTRLAVCNLITQSAQKEPLILILEDLHWADDASLEMLKFLLDRISDDLPLLFCLIFRPLKDYPIWQVWEEIYQTHPHPDCRKILLNELEKTESRQLLLNLLQIDQDSEKIQPLLSLILKETDGNPLYIEEALHALIEEGAIIKDETTWLINRPVDSIEVPDTLYQIIQSRIDELDFASPGARRVLWMAAVAGEEISQELLLHLFVNTGRQREEFFGHLRELRNAAMIEKVQTKTGDRPQQTYQFRHGMVRQVAYESMIDKKRREYHDLIGKWLEETYRGELPRYYDALAYHYDQGQEWKKAIHYHHLAGEQHKRDYANKEAAIHLQRLLDIGQQPGILLNKEMLIQANEDLAQVLAIMGQYNEALGHFNEALSLLEENSQNEERLHQARLCYHIGYAHERLGRLDDALHWQKKGLALIPEEPTLERGQLYILGSAVAYHQSEPKKLKQEAEQALLAAQAVDARFEEAQAHNNLHIYYRLTSDLDTAAEHCQRSAELYAELKNPIGEGQAKMNLGVISFEHDDWDTAETAYEEARQKLEQANEAYLLAMTYGNLADLYCHRGKLEQALACARQGLTRFTAQEAQSGIIFSHAVLATIFLRQNALDAAQTHLEQARTLIKTYQIPVFEPTVGRWLAEVHLRRDDVSQARVEVDALLSLGVEELDIEAEPIQRIHGRILAAQGELPEAKQVLQDSLERLEQLQARYEIARTQLALAEVLSQIEGKTLESGTYAKKARSTFAGLGAELDLQQADELLSKLSE